MQHHLLGWVRNTSGSVEIDAEGPHESIDAFLRSLVTEAPTLARVDSVTAIEADPAGYRDFRIMESQSQASTDGVVPADVCTCPDCLREITDPGDPRNDYPFTNCTNCGPRFTIVRRVPYDRTNTTMSGFGMCEFCAREYADPLNRRFHAEPTACPDCGPRIWLEMNGGATESGVLEAVGQLLRDGAIVAVKGLGGFHLACDAANDDAVRELRARKGRAAKPFAMMVRDLVEAQRLCELGEGAVKLIMSHQRPIVLARKRPATGISESVAPGNTNLGLMLPYTPLHYLLFEHSPPALVMTSANLSEEPLVFTNSSARVKLAKLADAFLMHDRDIHVPCDDSVVRPIADGSTISLRRARGYVPEAIELPVACDCILGTGAEQKNTFCLAWGSKAVLSQHIGDLDTVETFDYYQYAIDHFLSLFRQEPRVVAHDLHPGYMSTQYAQRVSGLPFLRHSSSETPSRPRLIGVQHHHAHIAACLAENARVEKCIGLSLDGTGYGTDGTIWGGEILVADLAGFERVGHLAQVRMPGGDAAVLDPRRMAVAYLESAFGEDWKRMADQLGLEFSSLEERGIVHQLRSGMNSPLTSSTGRLFDAVSVALGVCRQRSYEGEPAIALEMASDEAEEGSYAGSLERDKDGLVLNTLAVFRDLSDAGTEVPKHAQGGLVLNALPIFRAAVEERLEGVRASVISARFHNALVDLLSLACVEVRRGTSIGTVALSGGVFQNAIVLTRLRRSLEGLGFEVLTHKLIPPNDACISLGQVAIAAAILAKEV